MKFTATKLSLTPLDMFYHTLTLFSVSCLELIVKSLVDCLVQEKENFDGNLLASLRNGDKVD